MRKYNFAIVLNANAKKVTERVRQEILELVPKKNVFFSKSLEDSKKIAKEVIDKKFKAVFTGGGDGTVIQFINDLWDQGEGTKLPDVGILTLGTGNALACMVSSGNYLADIQSYMINKTIDKQKVYFFKAEDKRLPFAGLGLDAQILNDYRAIKSRYGESFLKPVFQNVVGYFFSFFARTAPKNIVNVIKKRKPLISLTNQGDEAYEINGQGEIIKKFKPLEQLFSNIVLAVVIGTTPYYGYGMKILPHTTQFPGFIEVRFVELGVFKSFFKLGKIWKGVYSGAGVRNFIIKKGVLTSDREEPYQTGGDAAGYRKGLTVEIDKHFINVIRFI